MQRMRTYLAITLGFALAGAIGASVGTGTAQAIVASLVEIVNPATMPVQTRSVDVTDPGRVAYQSQATAFGTTCSGQPCCSLSFPSVPAGHRLVLEQISIDAAFNQTPQAPKVNLLKLSNGSPAGVYDSFTPPSTPFPANAYLEPVLVYVDPSDAVNVQVCDTTGSAVFTTSTTTVSLTGYELDCTASACSPIATQ